MIQDGPIVFLQYSHCSQFHWRYFEFIPQPFLPRTDECFIFDSAALLCLTFNACSYIEPLHSQFILSIEGVRQFTELYLFSNWYSLYLAHW